VGSIGWVRRLAIALVAMPVLLLLAALPASAHAVLESTTPAQGSEVASAPESVSLQFSEEVSLPHTLAVSDERGRRVDAGAPVHPGGDSRTVQVRLRPGLARGSYTVSWRVVSVDGHPVAGTFAFGVGVPAGTVVQQQSVDPAVSGLRALVQLLSYLGAAVILGGSLFLFWLWPAGQASLAMRRLMLVGLVTAGIGAVGSLVVEGPYVAGLGVPALFDPSLLGETFDSSYGRPLLLRVLAVALSVPVLGIWPRIPDGEDNGPGGVAGVGNAVLLAASFSLTGHAAEASPRLLAEIADGVHLAAAGVWLGGLAVLVVALLPEADAPTRAAVVPRWSRVAMGTVALLVATGVYQAWRETRGVDAVIGTGYGRLLLIKLVAVTGLLGLAAVARRSVATRVVEATSPGGALRRVVETEAVLGVGVLAVTTFLVATPPARTTFAAPFSAKVSGTNADGGTIQVMLDVTPTRVGAQTLRVRTYGADGAPMSFVGATGVITPESGGTPVRATFTTDAAWEATADDVVVPSAGRWKLTVQVRTDQTTDYAATTTYTVQ
jgi:copper transport protein